MVTEESIKEDSIRLGFAAAQIVDGKPKMRHAIDQTILFLWTGITTSNASAFTVFGNWITAPTIARVLCNEIIRCYGLAESASISAVREGQLDWIMTSVVSQNLTAFAGRSFGSMIGGAMSGGFATAFFEAPIMGRLLLRCACDLIIILDRAFQLGNRGASRTQIRQAESEYLEKRYRPDLEDSRSTRQLVHREIAKLVPAFSVMAHSIYKPEQRAIYRRGISKIIYNHLLSDRTAPAPTKTSYDSSTTLATATPGTDPDRLSEERLMGIAASQQDEEVPREAQELERQLPLVPGMDGLSLENVRRED